jgi:hypothetical protein
MYMPKPTPHHDKLAFFTGSWTGEENMHPSPWDAKGGPAKAFIEARMDLDGMWLLYDYRQERDGKVTYRGHGVYGYDAKKNEYLMYWFDSMGNDPGGPARGKLEGDTLMFEMKSEQGFSRYIHKLGGDGRYEMSIHMSQDGKEWKPWLDSKWTRK